MVVGCKVKPANLQVDSGSDLFEFDSRKTTARRFLQSNFVASDQNVLFALFFVAEELKSKLDIYIATIKSRY